jgi:hypothetical protein
VINELKAALKYGNQLKNVFENALSVYSPQEIKKAFENDFNISFEKAKIIISNFNCTSNNC